LCITFRRKEETAGKRAEAGLMKAVARVRVRRGKREDGSETLF
jgi:hypothetical protein